MKKFLYLLIVIIMVLSIAACGDDGKVNTSDKKYVVGENAFEVGIYVKVSSSEDVKLFVEPTLDDVRTGVEENWKDGGMSSGTYGTTALVRGKKKGGKAVLEGSFTLYINDETGPTKVVPVNGTYEIDELTSLEHSFFFIYTNDGLQQVTKQEWVSFKTSKSLN